MFRRPPEALRRLSTKLGIASLGLAVLTTAMLWEGYRVKGTDGLPCAMIPGLLLVPVTLVLLALTVAAGAGSYVKTGASNWWAIPAALMFMVGAAFLVVALVWWWRPI